MLRALISSRVALMSPKKLPLLPCLLLALWAYVPLAKAALFHPFRVRRDKWDQKPKVTLPGVTSSRCATLCQMQPGCEMLEYTEQGACILADLDSAAIMQNLMPVSYQGDTYNVLAKREHFDGGEAFTRIILACNCCLLYWTMLHISHCEYFGNSRSSRCFKPRMF